MFGMGLVLALVGALLWVLYDLGVLTLDDARRNTWLGLIALSFCFGNRAKLVTCSPQACRPA